MSVLANKVNPEKLKAIEAAMGQIEKQFGKGSIMKLGEDSILNVESISTGSLDLDIALGIGGVPRGRIIEIFGPESSGKTTVALHILAEAQKIGGAAAFIDAEHALDPSYARNLGVDIDNLIVLNQIQENRLRDNRSFSKIRSSRCYSCRLRSGFSS